MVFRSTLLSYACIVCVLLALGVDAISLRHMQRSRAAPVAAPAFKQQAKAKTEATTEAAAQANVARSQAQLEHETKLLNLQQQQTEAMAQLKALHEAREKAERTLVHERLMVGQREATRLVNDLARMSTHKMMKDLERLNNEIAGAMKPRAHAHPSSIPIDTKLQQKLKQAPAASDAAAADAATPSNGDESEAKKQLHKQLVAKAAEVVDAQLDGILNSEELAYIKAHNDLGDTDSEASSDGEIKELDHDALPGESPDEHYNRLSKEADALMAKAYPFIKCEGANGGSSGGTGHGSSTGGSGGSTGEGSSVESTGAAGNSTSGETGSESGGTAETGSSGESGGTGLLEAGASAGTGAGAGGETGAAAGTGATAAAGGETAAAGATGASSSTGTS